MISLPDEHELIGFFEAEPELASAGVPWAYNKLTFATTRGSDRITCEIEPAFGELKVHWEQSGQIRANLKINKLANLSVHMLKNDEFMHVSGLGSDPRSSFKLRLKPHVSIELECWHEIP